MTRIQALNILLATWGEGKDLEVKSVGLIRDVRQPGESYLETLLRVIGKPDWKPTMFKIQRDSDPRVNNRVKMAMKLNVAMIHSEILACCGYYSDIGETNDQRRDSGQLFGRRGADGPGDQGPCNLPDAEVGGHEATGPD